MIGGISSFSNINSASTAQMGQSLFNKIDTDSDGSITKNELETFVLENQTDVDEIFNNLDTDEDGVISETEAEDGTVTLDDQLIAGFSMKMSMLNGSGPGQGPGSMVGPPPPAPGGEISMDTVDTNEDGSIDQDELTMFLESYGLEDKAETIFGEIDTDKDGLISSAELESAMEAMAPPPPPPMDTEEVAEITVEAVDTNEDSAIDRDELTTYLEENGLLSDAETIFGNVDAVGDGLITSSELTNAMDSLKAEMLEEQLASLTTDESTGLQKTNSKLVEGLLNSYYSTNLSSTIGVIDLLS